jgi:xanthine dehydrogenase accessory factor
MPTHPLPANLPQALLDRLYAGKSFALITVLKDVGSTPRKAGTRAIVDSAGEIHGTIGGGLLESEARAAAMNALRTGRPAVFDFPFSGTSARGDDPVCGGMMRILVDPNPAWQRDALERAATELRARRRGVLVTVVAGLDLRLVETAWLADGDQPVWGPQAARAVEMVRSDGRPRHFIGSGTEMSLEGLAELVVPAPLLLIAGGGHVAQALARQASLLDFEVALADDRPEFADRASYPTSVDVRCGRFRDLIDHWPLNRDTYVAIVGRGHKVDADALAAVIHRPVGYIGMMGSRRKVALLRREFVESGLAIGASIIAELIAVRRGKSGQRGRVS